MISQDVSIKPGVIKVVLKSDAKALDEVVVTAMGISREKKALGYAVQDVKSDQLTQAANSNLAGALQGKVSGLDVKPSSGMPGASSQITIRGARSFSGDNTPLYVIDGMPVTSTPDVSTDIQNNGSVSGADFANRAVDIDPNDIESINILKGQAASALYGIRASNGVIIITTKSGKGLEKGKPQVSFSSNVSFDVVGRLPEFQKTYAQGSGGVFSTTSGTSWGPKISELPNDATYGGNTDNEYTQKFGKQQGKYYVPQRAAAGLDPWATPQAYDNAKDFFDTGITWSNSLNVAQMLDKSSYSISLGNTHQDGIISSTGMDRYNVKVSAIIENYSYHYMYMTGKYYKQITGKDAKMNTAFCILKKGRVIDDKIGNKIMSNDGVAGVSFLQTTYNSFSEMMKSMDTVVIVLVFSAGLLAFIVLYNLNNINIAERRRELATFKVLGFYDMEVSGYIYRENVIITILGIIIGIGFGIILHQFVIQTAEIDMVMFGRNIGTRGYIYSTLLTILFAVIINISMHFKLKKVDMATSLKSGE